MSMILCRQEPVKHPFYFEGLGVRLFSSQELCYVIYNNPLLVMDQFVDNNLIQFIREDLDMAFLAAKLEKWQQSGEEPDELLATILHECDYYTASESDHLPSDACPGVLKGKGGLPVFQEAIWKG